MPDRTAVRLLESRLDELAARVRLLEQLLGEVSERDARRDVVERPASRHLTTREAAAYLDLSVSMLERWRCDLPGGPPFSRIGRRVLYAVADLDALVRSRRSRPLR